MKKLMLFVAISATSLLLSAQDVKTIYKQSSINLIADTNFGQGNDWNTIFSSYNESMYNHHIGKRKSLVVLPDGSVIVSHVYKNYYTKFSATGEFVKEFGVIGKNGKKIKELEQIACVLNNETLVTMADKMGTVYCLDFDGNLKKTLKLNYNVSKIIALGKDKIAVVGFSIWKNKLRDFVSIVDYNTNKEKIIWDCFTENSTPSTKPFNYTHKLASGGSLSISTANAYEKVDAITPRISYVNNKLIIALAITGEILTFDTTGKQISKDKLNWTPKTISVAKIIEKQKQAIAQMKDDKYSFFGPITITDEIQKIKAKFAVQMEADLKLIKEPVNLPVISTIINDNKNNLLIFEYPTADNDNKFGVWVYDNGGKVVGRSSFTCNDFDLEIIPSKMVFHNGYLYSLQNIKNANGIPMRLVRFKLQ